MCGQWVFGCDGTKADPHNRIGTRSENIHAAVLNEFALLIANIMRKGEAYTFTFTDPAFLHEAHALGPTGQLVLYVIQWFFRVVGNTQVIAWDFAFFYFSARAPAAAINNLLVG